MKQTTKEILEILENMSGRHSINRIFEDWITCYAISLSNVAEGNKKIKEEREKQYMRTIKQYNRDEVDNIVKMCGLLIKGLDNEIYDYLGEVFMNLPRDNKKAAQFFTPYSISKFTAKIIVDTMDLNKDKITLSDPACGSAGMIIAAIDVLQQKGIDFQRKLDVVVQDLDLRCVYMAYIQLSLLGVKAIALNGNTLHQPEISDIAPSRRYYTPVKILHLW